MGNICFRPAARPLRSTMPLFRGPCGQSSKNFEAIPSCLPTHRPFVVQLATDAQERQSITKKPHMVVEVTGTYGQRFQTSSEVAKGILQGLEAILEGWIGRKLFEPSPADTQAIDKAWASTVEAINIESLHYFPRASPKGETMGAASFLRRLRCSST